MKSLLLAATLLIATSLSGCSGFEINEAMCSEGEEPTWYATNPYGSRCIVDGEVPEEGEYRYPRGRVPEWINPPDSYEHKTADGDDLYNVNPNAPDYPWWEEVLVEHPELTCVGATEPVAQLTMKPASEFAPEVTVLRNRVGNHCFRFEWDDDSTVMASSLVVLEEANGPVWQRTGEDAASARGLLRVASDFCLRVAATLQVRSADGKTTTYELDRKRVRPTC